MTRQQSEKGFTTGCFLVTYLLYFPLLICPIMFNRWLPCMHCLLHCKARKAQGMKDGTVLQRWTGGVRASRALSDFPNRPPA